MPNQTYIPKTDKGKDEELPRGYSTTLHPRGCSVVLWVLLACLVVTVVSCTVTNVIEGVQRIL